MLMMTPPWLRYFWFHSIYSLAASCSLQSAVCSLRSPNVIHRVTRAGREPHVVLVSCKIGCPIFLFFFEYIAWCLPMTLCSVASRNICVSRPNHRICRRWPWSNFMLYSWRANVFIHRLWNSVYDLWITSNFPRKWHALNSKHNKCWKSSLAKIFHRNSSGERRLKFIEGVQDGDNKKPRSRASLSIAKAVSLTQRPQTCTETMTKYYNCTAKNTDEEREHRLLWSVSAWSLYLQSN